MNPALGFRCRNPLDTMDTRFEFQLTDIFQILCKTKLAQFVTTVSWITAVYGYICFDVKVGEIQNV